MNKLEQQITIEESVGLVERGGGPLGIYWQNNFGNGDRQYLEPEEASKVYLHLPCIEDGIAYYPLPDYLNDLNAMHEVERGLDDDLDCKYVNNLAEIVRPEYRDSDDMFYKSSTWTLRLVTASAAQRAEAYLRTIGKWKD